MGCVWLLLTTYWFRFQQLVVLHLLKGVVVPHGLLAGVGRLVCGIMDSLPNPRQGAAFTGFFSYSQKA